MRARNKKDGADFGLSFLDCICCGFGAIVLLFVITMGSANQMIQSLRDRLQQVVQQRISQIEELEAQESQIAQRAMVAEEKLNEAQSREEKLRSLMDRMSLQISKLEAGKEAKMVELEDEKSEIASMQTELEVEMILPDINLPVGLPVESNYIAFVFDTSGSMRDSGTDQLHGAAIEKIQNVLDSYPEIKGVQFLDADGRYMLRGTPGIWLPDDPATRRGALQVLASYPQFSNSNPVPGIFRAIRSLYQPDNEEMRMAVFVFGDEFTGKAEPVLARLEQINPRKDDGNRHVSINAVGFPTVLRYPLMGAHTGMKFANLMREVAYKHDGAFIAVRNQR
ncbi:hypothetical protein [Synoicihabitans lomoniglobus]|uniref:VWA domain-containing protein n=1 Tax=Synoicihabitans lomoniglobus TaxID=2909285 RepID=A0AAF0A1P5_9BACT|nr:hypothetical protein [Opitutaceae bacterium LMO-M01]WED65227.1 hypothetical protein PXH66_23050 [Opitutaceae bacterium LMO-M01]